MYGIFRETQGVKRKAAIEESSLFGLHVCAVGIPPAECVSARKYGRSIRSAVRLMHRRGARKILLSPESDYWPMLSEEGLEPIDTAELCRAAAAPLALDVLRLRGWEPERAVVALAEKSAGHYLFRAAEILAEHVRCIMFDVENGGEQLARRMYLEYGMPVVPPGIMRPALTVAFDSASQGRGTVLRLCGPRPNLLGSQVWAEGIKFPEEVDAMSALAAMRERGILSDKVLRAGKQSNRKEELRT